MTIIHNQGAGGNLPPATVKVWDVFVRVFHWSLVLLFVLAYTTADKIEWIHKAAGYAIAILFALRLVWGFVGTHHARFRNFIRSPREALIYLGDVLRLRAPRYLGHNPAGGVMIVALLLAISGTCLCGFMMTTDAYWGVEWLQAVHEILANSSVFLIALHLVGVLTASFEHKENLVKSMISGRKRVPGQGDHI